MVSLLGITGIARAEVIVGGAIGAGGRGAATYSALEARLDGRWDDLRLGLGARGVWIDGELRASDWEGWRALRVLRLFEAHHDALAIAAGGLAPAQLEHVAAGYRATLDDRPRTGVRGALVTERVSLGLELDDIVDPHLIGGAVEVGTRWIGCASTAIDPAGVGAIEGCVARRWARTGARLDAGGGVVGEWLDDGEGLAALGFVRGMLDAGGARWTASAELRAGSGSVGGSFGPLHRIEDHRERRGVGAAIAGGVAGPRGWLELFARHRPGGAIGGVSAGAPAGRWFQLAGWVAATRRDAAGAAELRITWATHLASALEIARIYDVDAMQPSPVWTATAWFAIQQAGRTK